MENVPDPGAGPCGTMRAGAVLGRGAVATVVALTDERGRTFAGKILHASAAGDAAAAARFAQEAELTAALVHPNIVRVFGRHTVMTEDPTGSSSRTDALVMEHVQGEDLATWIARRAGTSPAIDEVLPIVAGIARGLAAAHAAGIVHRDLKPANILLASDGTAKIADFGLARGASLCGVGTAAMTVLGTPDYMAPESLDPLAVDGRTDLYALGCIAFEMLAGQPPYHAATPHGVLQAHRTASIPTLPKRGDATPAVRALVQDLLAKSPADRPQSAAAVLERLAAARTGAPEALARVAPGGAGCPHCGASTIEGVDVCLGCTQAIAQVRTGVHAVLVTGPGEVGDKLDSALRDALVRWLQDSSRLGLRAAADLQQRIPRLPFVLTTEIAESSAAAIVAALNTLGLQAQAVPGNPARVPAMRAKGRSMAKRVGSIVAASSVGMFQLWRSPAMVVVAVVTVGIVLAWTVRRTRRAVTKKTAALPKALPRALHQAIERMTRALPAITAARHRDALRAVVARAVSLATAGSDASVPEALAGAVDAATAAAGRLSRLDATLSERGLNDPSPEVRTLLHERDTWSGRLLRLASSLDAYALRIAAAEAKAAAGRDEAALAELAAHVEALEEVQAL